MSKNIFIVFLVLMFFVTGCYTLNQIGEPVQQGIEITNVQHTTPVSHFTTDETVNHFIYGLVSPSNAEVEMVIANEIQKVGGTRAINIRMKYQQTFLNGLVNIITLGIYNPFTLTIEGDIVK